MAQLADTSLFNDANLVAYYKLEDVNDNKGTRNLTNVNAVTFPVAKFGNGAEFTAASSNQLKRDADNYGIAGNQDCSFPFWFRSTGAPANGVSHPLFIQRSQLTSDRYILLKYSNNAGTLQLSIDNSGNSTSYNVDLGTSIVHHIVLIRQGTTGIKLYLDNTDTGVTVAQGTNVAGIADFKIGNDGGASYVNGIVDDFGIFSDQITAAEVATLYNPLVSGGFPFMSY